MIPGMVGMVGMPVIGPPTGRMIDVLSLLGLTTGLKLCLDAGDSASYTSGQSWLDRSGGGYDFFLGTSGSATSTDPTFNGSPGAQSSANYFSFDGGDFFAYNTTNETWMDALHKDAAKFSAAAWIYVPVGATTWRIFSTGNGPLAGATLSCVLSSDRVSLSVQNGSTEAFEIELSPAHVREGGWNFIATTVDEPANSAVAVCNDVHLATACTYSSPSSSGGAPMKIGSVSGSLFSPAGSRINSLCMWQGVAVSAGRLNELFNYTRGKFGF